MRLRAATLLCALAHGAVAGAQQLSSQASMVAAPAQSGGQGAAATSEAKPTTDLFDLIRSRGSISSIPSRPARGSVSG